MSSDYARVARAIEFLQNRVSQQPKLEDLAQQMALSPAYAQRLFSRWAGVSPKRFLQALTVDYAKYLLHQRESVLQTSEAMGLSSCSRLFDHFVQLEAMTPAQSRQLGLGLVIYYGHHDSPFGPVFLAHTDRGVCRMVFTDEQGLSEPLQRLQQTWPNATLKPDQQGSKNVMQRLLAPVGSHALRQQPLSLLVQGTNFQIQVWRALLALPPAALTTYSDVAEAIGRPSSVRAVANAIGANPIALIIPCHRVIRSTGGLGGYRWGLVRKRALLTWELARSGQYLGASDDQND